MSKHVRIRCPVCGFRGTQKRLDQNHQFELIIQNTTSGGRGKIRHEYSYPDNEQGVWLLKLALIEKIEGVLEELKQELREEKGQAWKDSFYARQYAEARQVSSTYHADFSDMVASVDSLTGEEVHVLRVLTEVTSETPLSRQLVSLLSRPLWSGGVQSGQDDGVIEENVSVEPHIASLSSESDRTVSDAGGGSETKPLPHVVARKSDSRIVQGVTSHSNSRKGKADEELTQQSSASKLVE